MAAADDPTDPFDALGLPPTFDLDPGALARAYLGLSARLHPDIARADPDAALRSAAANRAKAILENPERRANALLARLRGPAKESDRSLPPGFLMEIMEIREAALSATSGGDPAETERWRAHAAAEQAQYAARISALFTRHAGAPEDQRPGILRDIRMQLNAWRYIERLIEQLEPGYDPSDADFREPPGG